MKRLLIAIAAVSCISAIGFKQQDDFARLDAALETADSHIRSKEQLLNSLDQMLSYPNISDEQKLAIYRQAFIEAYPYSFDRALAAVNNEAEVAARVGKSELQSALLEKTLLFSTAGLFLEAKELIENQIDTTILTSEQMASYHYTMQRFWKDYKEYTEDKQYSGTAVKSHHEYYRKKYIEETDSLEFWHRMFIVFDLLESNRFEESRIAGEQLIADLDPLSHEYAIAAYWQGVIYEMMEENELMMHWYINSAISDINNAVKDNASLSTIANKLLTSDVERASRYLQLSLQDACDYNAKLRPWQIARLVPGIELAYKKEQAVFRKRASFYLGGIAIMALIMTLAVVLLARALRKDRIKGRKLDEQRMKLVQEERKLSEANSKLQNAIMQLSEANRAKREYIALFLTMCSGYIDKLKKHISIEQKNEELKNFYNAFDNAFLHLYPNFVEQFNALLKPEERIVLKKDEILNTELRIFALIRLGITQSSMIASLLRYSVNTIYNYRAQIKNVALDERQDFEKSVQNIGSVEI